MEIPARRFGKVISGLFLKLKYYNAVWFILAGKHYFANKYSGSLKGNSCEKASP
jgi:hypothetical protein